MGARVVQEYVPQESGVLFVNVDYGEAFVDDRGTLWHKLNGNDAISYDSRATPTKSVPYVRHAFKSFERVKLATVTEIRYRLG